MPSGNPPFGTMSDAEVEDMSDPGLGDVARPPLPIYGDSRLPFEVERRRGVGCPPPLMPTTTEDRDEILQLLYRYNHAIDSGDAEGWADTWTEDGTFETGGPPIVGRAGLVEFASNIRGLRHMALNPVVELTGDTARVDVYVVVLHGNAVAVTGTARDHVVRTPAGWRLARRVFTADAPVA
jgi:SnoaL-like domain